MSTIEDRLITRYEYLDIVLHADRMLRRVRGVAS